MADPQRYTGHPTGVRPKLAGFAPVDSLACRFKDQFVAKSPEELQNHYSMFHSGGGPQVDRLPWVAPDGSRHATLPQKVAYTNNMLRPESGRDGMTGDSFNDKRLLEAHLYAHRFKRGVGSFASIRGDK